MPSTVFDSGIFRDAFGAPAMRAVFCDEAMIARYVEVEVALAAAEASVGVIPKAAAQAIKRLARAETIDVGKLKAETDLVGYPIVGLVHQLAKQCGDAGRYIHWGATTQDIMDTATVLQMRDALALVDADLAALEKALAALAAKHRDTVMAGRTHLQHALPVTFGYKAAVWLGMIGRHRERLAQLSPRVLVGQFAGAAGTLASLGDKGLAVHDALMVELGLGRASTPWHVARDGFAEAVSLLGLVTGTLAKIATDVMLLMQTEVGEAFEPAAPGRGGSSTMPHKRNPTAAATALAAATIAPNLLATICAAQVQEHVRALGGWQAEWPAFPALALVTSGALDAIVDIAEGLEVDEARMRVNLAETRGRIMAEAVSFALASKLGKHEAHRIVEEASRKAAATKRDLQDVMAEDDRVKRQLTVGELAKLFEPMAYQGAAQTFIDRLIGSLQARGGKR
jgi:3-carboxy-cis,cis-muconate cycloisomerase